MGIIMLYTFSVHYVNILWVDGQNAANRALGPDINKYKTLNGFGYYTYILSHSIVQFALF